jgi:hypothetical protein
MRIVLAGLVAAIALASAPPAAAQNTTNPICMRGGTFGPNEWDCSYYTMQQCLDSASGLNGTCGPNPNYIGPRRKGAPRRQSNDWGWGWAPGRY